MSAAAARQHTCFAFEFVVWAVLYFSRVLAARVASLGSAWGFCNLSRGGGFAAGRSGRVSYAPAARADVLCHP